MTKNKKILGQSIKMEKIPQAKDTEFVKCVKFSFHCCTEFLAIVSLILRSS